jgi:predicted transposase/invertase (TIGR01784 family)
MHPTFADPKTDFVFKRIFGSAPRKHLLIELLNSLLELKEGVLITDLSYLPHEQAIELPEMKLSIVDVKCIDQRGTNYVVEMQLLNVEGFEDRIVYNASKAFTLQLRRAEDYPKLKEVVAVTICDFSLFKETVNGPSVPMLSRWRMQEQHTAIRGLPQIQYVFLELSKYEAGSCPQNLLDKWAHFFCQAENLDVIPPELDEEPFPEAFEVARIAQFTEGEFEAYTQAKIAEQDARGALVLAQKQGRREGLAEGRREGLAEGHKEGREEGREEGLTTGLRRHVEDLCEILDIEITRSRREFLAQAKPADLESLRDKIKQARQWSDP